MSRVPGGHVQVKLPTVLAHAATASQLSVSAEHSSISVHRVPLWFVSSYPVGHAQVNPPGVLVHTAAASQLSAFVAHSSRSVQVTPLPMKPGWHSHWKLPGMLMHVALTSQ